MRLSICTTNYNCAGSLRQHLDSVFRELGGLDFEYVLIDNFSTDGSWPILQDRSDRFSTLRVEQIHCTIGEGRQLAFVRSRGDYIMVVDTDVVYSNLLRRFTDAYFEDFWQFSVQAIFCGIFPRQQWLAIGGRRSLNTNEDVDMWMRLRNLGSIRWYPLALGQHFKEPWAEGSADFRSDRYPKREKLFRLLRREWDLMKTRSWARLDLPQIIAEGTIDMGIGPSPGRWPVHRIRRSRTERAVELVREVKALARYP
jgi:glycosyltransferase involved in cell wall biosynthesis